jgi:hypothetical protein
VSETNRWTRALLHPVPLAFLLAGGLIAVALVAIPALSGFASRAVPVAFIGAIAYVAAVAILASPGRRPDHPALRDLRAIRQAIASRLASLTNGPSVGAAAALVPTLGDAVSRMDRDILPACETIVSHHLALGEQLAAYRSGKLPTPDGPTLARLQGIYQRQEKTLAACVRQAANADAALLALTQETDDDQVVRNADQWSRGLVNTLDALAGMLHGEDDGAVVAKG